MRCRCRGAIAAMVLIAATSGVALDAQNRSLQLLIHVISTQPAGRLVPRIERATEVATARYTEWLGPLAHRSAADQPRTLRIPEWSSPSTMDLESAVTVEIGRQWWTKNGQPTADAIVVDGVAWFLQSRIVEELYDHTFARPGFRSDAIALFGGTVRYGVPPLRLGRIAALRQVVRSARPEDSRALRLALALASIEQTVGWPALQGALLEAVRRSRSASLSLISFAGVLDTATGVSTSPIVTWYQRTAPHDLSIETVLSRPCTSKTCMSTRVAVAGTTTLPRPITVRATFSDGQQIDMSWNGEGKRVFDLESPSPAVLVQIDPDRAALLDTRFDDNQWRASASTNAPLLKWVSRWMVWLQDAMLAYSSLF